MNPDRADAMIHRCFVLSKHSILQNLMSNDALNNKSLIQMTSRMLLSRLSAQGVTETIKIIGTERQKLQTGDTQSSQNAGWGTSAIINADESDQKRYLEFLTILQEVIVKDYTAGT